MDDGEKSDKEFQYKCNLCDTQFKKEKQKASHKKLPFHIFMVGMKRTQQSYLGNAKTLNEQIAEVGKREYLVGLEYIYEYAEDDNGDRMYECKLCDSAFKTDFIFFHIVGIQHRVLYLAKHHPIMGIEAGHEVNQPVDYKKLSSNAFAIEHIHGRKTINVLNEVYESKQDIDEFSDTDSGTELPEEKPFPQSIASKKGFYDDPRKGNQKRKKASFLARKRRALARLRPRAKPKPRSRDDILARSRQRDRESRRDRVDLPRFMPRDPSQDFDGRTLMHESNPGSQNNSQDDAKGQLDTTGSTAQPRIDGFPPFQPPAAGVPPVGPGLPLIAGVGPTAQDAYDDTDFRRRRGGPSAAAGDPNDQNRRRNISPDPRIGVQRPGSRFNAGPGDVDVRSVLPSGGISFRELKTAHLKNIRAGGFSSTYVPLQEKKKKNKETDSDMEVCDMEFSDCEPDDFWCNEELFDYLKSYYIGDEEGVLSILESVRMLSEALVRHKSRKENLQKRILEEKQSLELEKKKFLNLKKSRQVKLPSVSMKSQEPGNVNLFNQVTGAKTSSTGTASEVQQSKAAGQQPAASALPKPTPVVQQAGQQPAAGTKTLTSYQQALVSGIAPLLQQPVQRPKGKKKAQQPVALSQKALMSGVGPLLQQLFLKPPEPQNVAKPPSVSGSQVPPFPRAVLGFTGAVPRFPGAAPQLDPLGSNRKRPSRFDTKVPGDGAGLLGPIPLFNQNPQNPGSRFNNPFPSNLQAPFPGQAAVRFPAPTNFNQPQQQGVQRPQGPANRFNQNPRSPFNIRGPVGAGLGPGSQTRFNQNSQNPASRFVNPSKEVRPMIGQGAGGYPGSDGRSNQSAQYPISWSNKSGYMDKTKQAVGAGSDSRFNQNAQYPGSWSDNSASLNKTKAALGAGSDGRFNQNAQYPGSWSDNSASMDTTKPGLGAGSDGRFNQNAQYPGSWSDNSASLNKTKPGLGADLDLNYKQMQWNSGPQSGNQGFYNQPRPTPEMGAGQYEEQHDQNQWQSQFGSRGAYGSGMDRSGSDGRFNQSVQYPGSWSDNSGSVDKSQSILGPVPQGPQAMSSTGLSSDKQEDTGPSHVPTKADVLPKSILKKRTETLP